MSLNTSRLGVVLVDWRYWSTSRHGQLGSNLRQWYNSLSGPGTSPERKRRLPMLLMVHDTGWRAKWSPSCWFAQPQLHQCLPHVQTFIHTAVCFLLGIKGLLKAHRCKCFNPVSDAVLLKSTRSQMIRALIHSFMYFPIFQFFYISKKIQCPIIK